MSMRSVTASPSAGAAAQATSPSATGLISEPGLTTDTLTNKKGGENPMEWIEAGKADDVPEGSMKLVEAGGVKITLAKVEGSIYAFNDRCPHMSAPLHLGKLVGKQLICPLHFAGYDVTTGKKLTEPRLPSLPGPLKRLMKDAERSMEIMAQIEAHDLETYETKVEDGRVMVRV
ncbi:MAG: Rieske (2Fe-2S) protein [Methanobacteriota archaeon]|nr:MAG: Rieske (2Fe-2S) protein [Euryarchaeota archaeon]